MTIENNIIIDTQLYDAFNRCKSSNDIIVLRQSESSKYERVLLHKDFDDYDRLKKYLEGKNDEYTINRLYIHVQTINDTKGNIDIKAYMESLINILSSLRGRRETIGVFSGGDDTGGIDEIRKRYNSISPEVIVRSRGNVRSNFIDESSHHSSWEQEQENSIIPKKFNLSSREEEMVANDADRGYPDFHKKLISIRILFYPNWLDDDISSIKDSLNEGQNFLDGNKKWEDLSNYEGKLEESSYEYKAFNAVKNLKEVLTSDLTDKQFRKKYEALCKTVCNRES